MTQQNFIKLLNDLRSLPKECEWAEFKENNSNPQEIGEYLSALSNSACYHKKEYAYLIFGIEEHNYTMASKIISDTLKAELIKDYDSENKSRKYAKYVPYWF
jgi:predicted HTH transcriptional regulator